MTSPKPPNRQSAVKTAVWLFVGLLACAYLGYSGVRYFSGGTQSASEVRERFKTATASGHSTIDLAESTRKTTVDQQIANLAPEHAGWTSESASASISQQLKRLAKSMSHSERSADVTPIVASSFSGSVFPNEAMQTVYQLGNVSVEKLPNGFEGFRSTNSFGEQWAVLVGSNAPENVRCKFKVVKIKTTGQTAESDLRIEATYRSDSEISQTSSLCRCQWNLNTGEPTLTSLEILDTERTKSLADGRTLFDDVTATVFAPVFESENENGPDSREQILRDTGYWSERLCAIDDTSIFGHHGIAVGDVNGDGLADLYVCDTGGLPNRLYVQSTDGTLRDVSRKSNTDWLEATSSALLVDLDNDGDADIVAATVAGIIVAANNGDAVFTIRAAIPNVPEAYSTSAADYDNDGDLDIYITVYGPGGSSAQARGFEAAAPIPYHDANNGGPNVLLQNRGDFQFANVTDQVGLDQNNQRFSFAASWEDFDSDGDMDLYVANDFGRNNLYRNRNGQFTDVAPKLGVEDMAGGMSVSWGDANQDGRMDIYVGNMFSAAGNRVTYQRRFLDSRPSQSSTGIQRMARGNTLFLADQQGSFADTSQASGVLMGRWAWSSKFADINNDGREDIVVANGYFTNDRADDL